MNAAIKEGLKYLSEAGSVEPHDRRFARETLAGKWGEHFGAWLCRKYRAVLIEASLWSAAGMSCQVLICTEARR